MLDPHAHTRFHKISAEPGPDASHLALTDSVPGRISNGNLTLFANSGERRPTLFFLAGRHAGGNPVLVGGFVARPDRRRHRGTRPPAIGPTTTCSPALPHRKQARPTPAFLQTMTRRKSSASLLALLTGSRQRMPRSRKSLRYYHNHLPCMSTVAAS